MYSQLKNQYLMVVEKKNICITIRITNGHSIPVTNVYSCPITNILIEANSKLDKI